MTQFCFWTELWVGGTGAPLLEDEPLSAPAWELSTWECSPWSRLSPSCGLTKHTVVGTAPALLQLCRCRQLALMSLRHSAHGASSLGLLAQNLWGQAAGLPQSCIWTTLELLSQPRSTRVSVRMCVPRPQSLSPPCPSQGSTSHPLGVPKLQVYEVYDVQIHGSHSCWETRVSVLHEKLLSPWGLAWISAPLPDVGSLWVELGRSVWVPPGSTGRMWLPRWALPLPSSVDVNLGSSVDDVGSFPCPSLVLTWPTLQPFTAVSMQPISVLSPVLSPEAWVTLHTAPCPCGHQQVHVSDWGPLQDGQDLLSRSLSVLPAAAAFSSEPMKLLFGAGWPSSQGKGFSGWGNLSCCTAPSQGCRSPQDSSPAPFILPGYMAVFLAVLVLWDILSAFSRYSVRVFPCVDVFWCTCGRRWAPHPSIPSSQSSLQSNIFKGQYKLYMEIFSSAVYLILFCFEKYELKMFCIN